MEEEIESLSLSKLEESEFDRKLTENIGKMIEGEMQPQSILKIISGELHSLVKQPSSLTQYLSEIYKGKKINKGVCGKVLTPGMAAYVCRDCELDPTCIICTDCFENGNHEGHRFELKKAMAGMCDCGDVEAWKTGGNCQDHKGFIDEKDPYIDPIIQEGMIKIFQKAICYVLQAFELLDGQKSRDSLSRLLRSIIDAIQTLKGEFAMMGVTIGTLLIQKPKSNFSNFKMMHDDKDRRNLLNTSINQEQECNSSLTSLLMRFYPFYTLQTQKQMNSFFISNFSFYPFKSHFASTYVGMVNFQMDWDNNMLTHLGDISVQILTSEDLSLQAIKEVGLSDIYSGLKRLIDVDVETKFCKNYSSELTDEDIENLDDSKILQTITKPIFYSIDSHKFSYGMFMNLQYLLMKKKAVIEFLRNEEELNNFFGVFEKLHIYTFRLVYSPSHNNFDVDKYFNTTINFYLQVTRMIKNLLSCLICVQDNCLREQSFINLARALIRHIYNIQKHDEQFQKKFPAYSTTFDKLSQDIFTWSIISYMYFCSSRTENNLHFIDEEQMEEQTRSHIRMKDIDAEEFREIIDKVFQSDNLGYKQQKEFWKFQTQSLAAQTGFIREISNNIWGFYGEVASELRHYYNEYEFHNSNIVGLQICALALKEDFYEEFRLGYFSNPPSIHIQTWELQKAMNNFYKDGKDKKVCIFGQIADFFNLIFEIITNEFSLGMILNKFEGSIKKQNECQKGNFQIVRFENLIRSKENYILDIFLNIKSTSVEDLMTLLNNTMKDKSVIDKFLDDYTQIDRVQRKIILKKNVEGQFTKTIQTEEKDQKFIGILRSNILWFNQKRYSDIYSQFSTEEQFIKSNLLKMNKPYLNHSTHIQNSMGKSKIIFESLQMVRENIDQGNINLFGKGILLVSLFISQSKDDEVTRKINQYWQSIFSENQFASKFLTEQKSIIQNFISKMKIAPKHELEMESEQKQKVGKTKNLSKTKKLKKKKKTIMNSFAQKNADFLASLDDQAEDIIYEIQKENGGQESVSCIVCTMDIQEDEHYCFLGNSTYSNVNHSQIILQALRNGTIYNHEQNDGQLACSV